MKSVIIDIDSELEQDRKKILQYNADFIVRENKRIEGLNKIINDANSSDSEKEKARKYLDEDNATIKRIVKYQALKKEEQIFGLVIDRIFNEIQNKDSLKVKEYFKKMKELVDSGANPDVKSLGEMMALSISALAGNVEMVNLLKEKGADIYQRSTVEDQTLLHFGLSSNSRITALLVLDLIENGVQPEIINYKNKHDITPLGQALISIKNVGPIMDLMMINENVDDVSREDFRRIYRDTLPRVNPVVDFLRYQKVDAEKYINSILKVREQGPINVAIFKLIKLLELRVLEDHLNKEESEVLNKCVSDKISILDGLISIGDVANITKALDYSLKSIKDLTDRVEKGAIDVKICEERFLKLIEISDRLIERKNTLGVADDKMDLTALHLARFYCFPELLGKMIGQNFSRDTENKVREEEKEKTEEEIFKEEKEKAWERFPSLMGSAQKSAIRGINFESEIRQLSQFVSKFDFDVNIKTEEGWSLLHLAAKGGYKREVDDFISKGFDVNGLTVDGVSIIRLAVDSKNSEVVESILSCENLDVDLIKDAIKYTIQSGNKNNLLSSFVRSSVLINKFAENFSKREFEKFYSECNGIINRGVCGNKLRSDSAKSCIKSLIDAVNEITDTKKSSEMVLESIKKEGFSEKNLSRKKREKLAKEVKREIEEKFKQMREQEVIIRADENQKMLQEDSSAFLLRESDKILTESRGMEAEEAISKTDEAERKKHDLRKKMLQAKEFVPAAQVEEKRKQDELRAQQDDMEIFLEKKGQGINRLLDIPPFVADIIIKLKEAGYKVLLRGSSVNKNCKSDRKPVDLDIEVIGVGFMENDLDGSMAQNFFRNFFNLEISNDDIYRGNGDDYTISVKDKLRKLDISFYDSKSKSRYTWLDSKEKKRIIEDDGFLREVKPIGFDNYLRRIGKFESHIHGVIFNSDAKKLILITALRQTLGILSKDEIDPQVKTSEYGLLKAISPIDPIDLLSQELKVGGRDFIISDDKNNFIKNKIGIFMKSHALDHEYQLKFLSNLSEMISKTNGVRTVPNTRHAMIANAIYEMKSALQTPKTELEAKEALRVFSNEVKLG